MSQSTEVDPDAESLRLAQQLEDEEFAAYREPALGFSEAELAEMDDETRQSIELAMRLQEEERLRIQEQQAAAERLEGQADDEESIALAIRLQQEDDESALRNALGVTDGEPGSPSEYTYEQLMRLQDTVGMVSRGASQDDISALRTLTVKEARRPGSNIVLGEQCSICRMEFEPEDMLRVLRCGHAEHTACLDQWLMINKSCPLCQCEVHMVPQDKCAPLVCPPVPPPPLPFSSSMFSPVASTPTAARMPTEPPPLQVSAPLTDGTNVQAPTPPGACVLSSS